MIPKTTWLSYIGNTYNSLSTNDVTRFNSAVLLRSTHGDGYRVQYVEALSSIDIISIYNSSHLEEIKALLSEENFLKNLCDLMSGMEYEDIIKGKYKLAFEPVAYFRYNGQNWAMSATECGLLNKYMKNYFSSAWNSTNNLRALLGPLTHSNLPRSAFLENKDLGISVYSPSTSDYYNGNSNYNSDTCIIRCMGIGVLTGNSDDNDDEIEEGTAAAEYHTDTDVYTSFYAVNIGDTPFIGKSSFSIFDSGGDTPRMYEQLKEENNELIKVTGSQSGVSYTYAYTSTNVLFPEFNYNRHSTTLYNRLLEKSGGSFVFRKNKYSTYNDRVHVTPIWFPDRKNYTVYVEVFDVWCPAGQLSVRLTDQIFINGNVYDDWHIAPTKP